MRKRDEYFAVIIFSSSIMAHAILALPFSTGAVLAGILHNIKRVSLYDEGYIQINQDGLHISVVGPMPHRAAFVRIEKKEFSVFHTTMDSCSVSCNFTDLANTIKGADSDADIIFSINANDVKNNPKLTVMSSNGQMVRTVKSFGIFAGPHDITRDEVLSDFTEQTDVVVRVGEDSMDGWVMTGHGTNMFLHLDSGGDVSIKYGDGTVVKVDASHESKEDHSFPVSPSYISALSHLWNAHETTLSFYMETPSVMVVTHKWKNITLEYFSDNVTYDVEAKKYKRKQNPVDTVDEIQKKSK